MNKGQGVLLAACAGYFGLWLSIMIKSSKEAKRQKEARRKSIQGCVNAWASFIDMLAGAMAEEPDPFKNERIKLKIHRNHGDVNLNKDLGQK